MLARLDDTTRQQRLIRALEDPACYPHPVHAVDRVETHISTILLAGDYAYKLKKPLKLDFLDYSTLERRQHYCRQELELNRQRAPELYLECVAITGTLRAPRVGGSGPPLEYAVRMRRFPERCRLDHLLEAGRLSAEQMEAIGRELAILHDSACPAPRSSPWASASAQAGPIRDNLAQLAHLFGDDPRLQALHHWTEGELRRRHGVLEQRVRNDRIRDCHGDLHLANLIQLDGRFLPFDGIEFDDALRWIDVLNDLAFLLMDLDARKHPQLGARLLNAWLDSSGDHAGMPLLRLYKTYRALVRAKINAIRLQQLEPDSIEAGETKGEMDRYLLLAADYAVPPRPGLWVMAGLSGSGKSTLALDILEREQAIRLRSDVERKRLFGLESGTRTGAAPGGGIYGPEAGRRTYRHLRDTARLLLQAGWPVIIDAACLKRAERDSFRALAAEGNWECSVIWCQANTEVLRERVRRRQQQGRDPSEADEAVLEQQLASHEPPTADEPCVELVSTE